MAESTDRSESVATGHTGEHLPYDAFVWGVGIECSTLPHLGVDQFAWTQHDRHWREDFGRITRDLGLKHLRYAIPWHLCEPSPGRFDWSVADERIDAMAELGLVPLMDVMHFGTPLWLRQAVGDPLFPESLERFTRAMVERYADRVSTWCPFNEPLVTALFSGDFGFWPPHSRKWRGYMPVVSRIAQAVSRGIRAVRDAQPDATVLLCDASENFKTRSDPLKQEVAFRNLRRFLMMDLVSGRVDDAHPLHAWVTNYGMSGLDLTWFRQNPQLPDVLGLDYYPHSDWQLDLVNGHARQKRADSPVGIYGVANAYWQRYGLPLMVTETSIEGKPINREIWLDRMVDDARRLREEGVPMLGMIWWPMIDHLDWDGAMTHRVGKLHEVGLFKLVRQPDGSLKRVRTPLADQYAAAAAGGDERVGPLASIAYPTSTAGDADPLPPLVDGSMTPVSTAAARTPVAPVGEVSQTPGGRLAVTNGAGVNAHGNGHGNGHGSATNGRAAESPLPSPADLIREQILDIDGERATGKSTGRYGILVFSHLRWGFVWQRPQQFLSRFAKKHPVLFIEEPFFDVAEGGQPRLDLHQVMPNVTVACPHCPPNWAKDRQMPDRLRTWTNEALEALNEDGLFDRPLLWYYSPMDAGWSLGHFENRGVVYDCMDELSQFTGAPKQLIFNESRLMEAADVVFTGGYNLWTKKSAQHANAHFFGCGVEFSHFAQAQNEETAIPPDIDFMNRPILGWFGVVDERVDYAMVGEMARMRPDWSFAMVGPVVKVDPNLLPHSPNLYWLGGRDYSVLPNYCRAFDINMMCFAINAATEYINPTKALEYLATGKPVISTPVKDVLRQYRDLVDIAPTAEAFVAAADGLLRDPQPERVKRGIEKARDSSWEATVKQMQDLIDQAITQKDRPSTRPLRPVESLEREYQYVATQGS